MKLFKEEHLSEILAIDQGPCISVYMPTHRSHPENQQDHIKFKNLIKDLEKSLSVKYSNAEVNDLMVPFHELITNEDFWNNNHAGIAVFGAKDFFEIYGLSSLTSELAIAADSFHTKPLRQYLQSVDRYHILGVNLHEVKLYEGNRYSISEVILDNEMPVTIEEALGEELTEPHLTTASYGGAGQGTSAMFHGHGSKKDEVDKDAERFFRTISTLIHEKYSKPTGLPLILATLPEHKSLFFKVSNNSFLLETSIDVVPETVPREKLIQMAWEIMEPAYLAELDNLSESFSQSKNDKLGSDSINEIAKAAFEGRVDTLLIEADKIVAGKIDQENGKILNADINQPDTDDLLDDLGELVIKMGGKVKILPQDRMPVQTGIAAIFRY
jgi:hypothetical protein